MHLNDVFECGKLFMDEFVTTKPAPYRAFATNDQSKCRKEYCPIYTTPNVVYTGRFIF